jgi:hypothetical protein
VTAATHARTTLRKFKQAGLAFLRAPAPIIRQILPSFAEFIAAKPFSSRTAVKHKVAEPKRS